MLNEARYARAWCENVLQFSRDVIVFDCGSTDGTPDIVSEYTSIELHRVPQSEAPYGWNEGVIRNTMIEMCSEPWIIDGGADELYGDGLASELVHLRKTRHNFITFPYLDFWHSRQTVRARRIGDGLREWMRFHPTRRLRMFRNRSGIRYKEMTQVGNKHTYLLYGGTKFGWRFSHHRATTPIFHYNYCFPPKINGNRREEIGKTGIRLETYYGPQPESARLIL